MSYFPKKTTKPKSSAWNYFKPITEYDEKFSTSAGIKYQCIYCNTLYAGHATRLTRHLSRGCRKCPRSVAAEFTNLLNVEKYPRSKTGDELAFDRNTVKRYESDDTSDSNKILQHPVGGNIFQCASEVPSGSRDGDAQYQFIAESLYARAYFSERLSLKFTENEYWREFFNFLNSHFAVPSKTKLLEQLLQREHTKIVDQIHDMIENSNALCLQCLISSDAQNNFSVNFVINVPKPLFLKSITTSCREEIPYHVEREVTSILNDFGQHKIVAILTNDPSVLESFNQETLSSSSIIRFNCASTSLDLLLCDIFDVETASLLRKNSFDIVEELQFKISELSAEFDSSKKDNWESVLICFETLIENEVPLKSLVSSEILFIPKSIQKLIRDPQFWNDLKKLNLLVKPIIKWMNDLSSNLRSISTLVNCFHEIEIQINSLIDDVFSKIEAKKIRQSFLHSREITITPLHLSANILDPKWNGSHLSDDEQILGSEFIDRISSVIYKNDSDAVNEVLCELARYRCHEGIFSASYVRKTANDLSPEVWWKGSCYGLKLSRVADFILSVPVSMAGIEPSLKFDTADMRDHNMSAEQLSQYLFTHKNLRLMQHSCWFENEGKKFQKESEEIESVEEKLMSEEDISEIEYEITLDDCDDDDFVP